MTKVFVLFAWCSRGRFCRRELRVSSHKVFQGAVLPLRSTRPLKPSLVNTRIFGAPDSAPVLLPDTQGCAPGVSVVLAWVALRTCARRQCGRGPRRASVLSPRQPRARLQPGGGAPGSPNGERQEPCSSEPLSRVPGMVPGGVQDREALGTASSHLARGLRPRGAASLGPGLIRQPLHQPPMHQAAPWAVPLVE